MQVELTDEDVEEVLYALSLWRNDIGHRVDQALQLGHTDVVERASGLIGHIDALAAKFGGYPLGEGRETTPPGGGAEALSP